MDERLLEEVYTRLLECHVKARKGKRKTLDEHRFEVNLFENLLILAREIIEFKYEPSPGVAFIVQRPVVREIFAAPYRDRIIHHLIFSCVEPYWENHFIYNSCSCRKGKGTLFGIRQVEKYVRKATRNYTEEAEVFKYDLSGYFMSLPRRALYYKAIKGLNEQFKGQKNNIWYRWLKYLWRKIIMDDPTVGVKIRGSEKDWSKLPRCKSLFFQPKGQGIVIGNLTSQLLSNIYLNDFDHYMKDVNPGCYYVRYVDDFMIIANKKYCDRVKSLEGAMRVKLTDANLRINEKKTYHQDIKHGIAFLGVVIYPWRTVIGKRLKKNMKIACGRYRAGKAGIETLVSYAGFTVHHSSANLTKKFLDKCLYEEDSDE